MTAYLLAVAQLKQQLLPRLPWLSFCCCCFCSTTASSRGEETLFTHWPTLQNRLTKINVMLGLCQGPVCSAINSAPPLSESVGLGYLLQSELKLNKICCHCHAFVVRVCLGNFLWLMNLGISEFDSICSSTKMESTDHILGLSWNAKDCQLSCWGLLSAFVCLARATHSDSYSRTYCHARSAAIAETWANRN